MVIYCYALADLGRSLRRSFIVTFLAVIAILGGVIPEFSWTTEVVSFQSSAYTQDFTADQIKRYANRSFVDRNPKENKLIRQFRKF
jgi:hypothetical protein